MTLSIAKATHTHTHTHTLLVHVVLFTLAISVCETVCVSSTSDVKFLEWYHHIVMTYVKWELTQREREMNRQGVK